MVNNEPLENQDDDFISKTQLKKDAKALQAFGKQLIEMSDVQLEQLPLRDATKNAVRDFHKQQGNIAKKRHLSFIGKCLRNDDAQAAITFIQEDQFSQQRQVVQKPKQADPFEVIVEQLISDGEPVIQSLIENNPQVERQTLRQKLRNLTKAKEGVKQQQAKQKLIQYLKENQVEQE